MKDISKKLKVLVLCVILLFPVTLTSIADAIDNVTGKYMPIKSDIGVGIHITTGLTNIGSLRIVAYNLHGRNQVAYTSDEMQGVQPGLVMIGNKWDSGIFFGDGGVFIVNHPDFTKPGVWYFWEAHGD